ncbi:metallophosphoesterase [Clostridium neuense]
MIIKLVFVIFICMAIFKVYIDNNLIEVLNYKIHSSKIPKEFNGFKILQISDLHSKSFGKENIDLINKVEAVEPNIIVITGDMVNNDFDYSSFISIVNKLTVKYKIYYVIGNHEQNVIARNPDEFNNMLKEIKEKNVSIINNKNISISMGKQSINLYGMYTDLKYYRDFRNKASRSINFSVKDMEELIGKCDKNAYNLLLTHNPVFFSTYSKWGADLTLTGHVHGGMVKLPLLGGIFSPEYTLFPKYYEGIYKEYDNFMNVNRGLGRGNFGIRLFNRPELSVITLYSTRKYEV